MQPGATEIDGDAILRSIGMRAPADAIAGLDHLHREAARHEGLGGGETGGPGTDDRNIQIGHRSTLPDGGGLG